MPNPFLTTSSKKKKVGGNPFLPTTKKASGLDLNTSEGLYTLAVQSGVQKQADKLLAQKGEQTKKIFSGGFISDIFDVLNTLQYGVVGVLKGKSFKEGVLTRQSFSDKDALGNNGLPGVIGGIALDIAVDPLTYIAPWTILKKIPGFAKAGKLVSGAVKASDVGQWFGRKLIYRFGQDPIYKEIAERSIKNIAVGQQNIIDLAKPLTKLDSATQKAVAEARKAGKLGKLSPDILKKVKPVYDELDKLSKEAIDVLPLSKAMKATYKKNVGTYLKRAYKTIEAPEGKKILGIFPTKPKRIPTALFKARKDLPDWWRAAHEEILEAGYPTAKSMLQLKEGIENAKFFTKVSGLWGSKIAKEGFEKLPETNKLGALAGKYVPKSIFDDIQEIIRVPKEGEKIARKIIGGFKYGKVILNPATHARNVMSNRILNWWKLGMNPLDPRVIKTDAIAIKEIAKGGKWVDEAKTVGYNLNTFAANELKGLLKETKISEKLKGIPQKLANIYQGEENWAKLSAFIFNRSFKKLGIEDAWKAAESATFNYAQVTPFIRRLRESIFGYPFITFAIKSAPIAVETAFKYPRRISSIGKIKNAIENMADIKTTERERASEPDWVKDGFYIKLPMKDSKGRSAYFDLSYIVPFGDLISGQFFERTTMRETGLPESMMAAQMKKLPLVNLIREIGRNQDFYGDKIWNDSASQEKQLGDLFRHISKTYLPPMVADQIPGGHMAQGGRRIKGIRGALTPEAELKQQRTLTQEILRNVGLKVQPIDVDIQEEYMEWEKKKALKTLLEEMGITKEFQRTYVPKNQ
jgi:hypothetical protein